MPSCARSWAARQPAAAPTAAQAAWAGDGARRAEGCRHQLPRRADDPGALPASPRAAVRAGRRGGRHRRRGGGGRERHRRGRQGDRPMRTGGLCRGGRRAGEPDQAVAARASPSPRAQRFWCAHSPPTTRWRRARRSRRGETLLVLGAAGGVGLAAVQLGKALGARVLAAASSPEKLEALSGMAPSELIDYSRKSASRTASSASRRVGASTSCSIPSASRRRRRCAAWRRRASC